MQAHALDYDPGGPIGAGVGAITYTEDGVASLCQLSFI
ncbi:MAG: hypothetical protein RL701_3519 [Pseudomonadota bacterium]